MTDYLCAKFGDFSFSHSGFIMQTDRESRRQMIAILTRLPSASVIIKTHLEMSVKLHNTKSTE